MLQRGDGAQVLRVARRLELRVGPAEVVAAEAGVGAHAPGEQPATERAVGQRGDAVPQAVGQDPLLGLALEQVVRRLRGVERRDLAEQVHLLRGVVADADRADAALPVERVERLRRLLDRHQRIRSNHHL